MSDGELNKMIFDPLWQKLTLGRALIAVLVLLGLFTVSFFTNLYFLFKDSDTAVVAIDQALRVRELTVDKDFAPTDDEVKEWLKFCAADAATISFSTPLRDRERGKRCLTPLAHANLWAKFEEIGIWNLITNDRVNMRFDSDSNPILIGEVVGDVYAQEFEWAATLQYESVNGSTPQKVTVRAIVAVEGISSKNPIGRRIHRLSLE